jgi:hypothetical protein
MCPVCITTTLTLIAGSATATGGLTALAAKILRKKTGVAKLDHRTESEGEGK